ncbi:Eukaryotic translation initiation factor 2C_ 2 [Caligus rogercresseyi]|uniref:Eukaryotic translation initiation factor 2C_ 2 n=1 Tax=Caligus rogercresseyi TaxID=217165 RepID=A0A7T8GQA5_CALRO|nr:Eukaryotic translation initiation factor 2C_ 2 [Caligus rogercresseyi]
MNYGLARPGVHRGFGLKRIKLSVNCVEVKDVPDEVYQYTVDLKPDTTPMSIRRKVLQAFIKEKGDSVFIDSINGTPIHPAYDGSRLLFSRTI